ncbi:MAG: TenA family protein [Pseudomonadota bacterium]|uniref:TenA family protein n=1 Tax=Fodinicurvata fenggangensis TaxID=1121830 RepID=UPI00047EEBEB|nr:TenA family protein [Fodinicurvata fenggangensis]
MSQPDSFAAFQSKNPDAAFHDWLRESAEPFWTRATAHRFTEELAEGTLDPQACARYLVQDYAFVDSFVSLLGYAVAYAPAMPEKRPFAGFLAAVTSEENDYFLRSFRALGVPDTEWREPELAPVTAELLSILQDSGRSGSYPLVLATLLAAEWSYLTWGLACGARRPREFWMAEWIDLHAVPEFQQFVTWLRDETSRVGAASPPDVQQQMCRTFRHMMQLEERFFDHAYTPETGT